MNPEEEIDQDMKNYQDERARLEMLVGSEALAKSIMDPFDYALRLRTGEIIHYSQASLIGGGKWVHLSGISKDDSNLPFLADRGIDVLLNDIVWCMDAPNGS